MTPPRPRRYLLRISHNGEIKPLRLLAMNPAAALKAAAELLDLKPPFRIRIEPDPDW